EILKLEILTKPLPHEQDLNDARKLGIEALKQTKISRTYGYLGLNFFLPGETTD
ncbi:unnamed protein product, partial [marine sediment metagenome]